MPDDEMDALKARLDMLETRLVVAEGEALYAGLLAPALMSLVVTAGAVAREAAVNAVDTLMLVMERRQDVSPGKEEAILFCRLRAESLLQLLRKGPQ